MVQPSSAENWGLARGQAGQTPRRSRTGKPCRRAWDSKKGEHTTRITVLILAALAASAVVGCTRKKAETEAEMRERIRREERIRLEERQRLLKEKQGKAEPMARPLARKPAVVTAPLKGKAPGVDAILKAATLADAIRLVKPVMTDEFDKTSPGALTLTIWALKKMAVDAIRSLPRTKHALVMKDADEHRGKAICSRVRIVEIRAEKSQHGKFFEGAGFLGYGLSKIVRFIAVGTTGNLTAKSRAKFCGVVIGRLSYRNSAGGSSHGVQLVGMFDLPGNRAKKGHATAEGPAGMVAAKHLAKRPAKRKRKVRTFAGRASVSGGLDAASIRRVIRRNLGSIKFCYMSVGLAKKPGLAGMVKVSFTITSSGSVGQVQIAASTLSHRPTESCIKAAIRRWRFPKPEGTMPFVTYPFHFKPKG